MLEEARKKLPEVPFEARVVPWKQTAMVGFLFDKILQQTRIKLKNVEVFLWTKMTRIFQNAENGYQPRS